MKEAIKPNFFVVGAPKSGTTSLYFYLKEHPQVFLPRIKELNFFCTDLHFRYPILSEEQFMQYYKDWMNQPAVGEVSVWNLYSAAASENIYSFNPDAKIIIMLRHPVDMMHALHSNHVYNSNEIIPDFEEAIAAQDERKEGKRISPTIKCPVEGLYYFDVAAYSNQVKRYIDLFGKERVKVILFDEFSDNTTTAYLNLLKFLDVDPVLPSTFKIFNQRKVTRSNLLKQLTIAPPEWLKSTGRWLFPHQSKGRDWLMFWLWKLNTIPVDRKALSPVLRESLTEKFKDDIKILESVIDKDLSGWL
ncbi:MAG: sulfotransferase [Chitinophagales bacterium]|nr:sulfotransferase [Chitinophagales bacterium]